ncbi:unnamed protein product [Triticum turgidum subsp. durum]|uniref:4-hydroxy-7-methoxy-3-oxo-3,4-dihydro-2H-1,4-benzoxazin-2-yl glucosidebeta-D-glucosidase n=1 Tax=Triticum turgidum subsp. durum TaxID=4567 RepID=A0A9R1ANN2_TRITD|nr:unnamed protein product [Triticum turgidum subsp. durum]
MPMIFPFPVAVAAALFAAAALAPRHASALTRHDFPEGFVFGAGTSAYQVEGAAAEDGRKPSIWDTFTHQGHSSDGSTADVSADQYHHYKEDVKLMHKMGLDAYRFSISWPRLIPAGRGQINPKGLEYYNNLIDELILHGIQPHVTIYHFDLPQVLQDEYGGLLSPRFIDDYTAYANVCFKSFGDRVKHWAAQGGQIGITLLGWWHEPATDTPQDAAAAVRMNDFHIGWFMHPLVYGDYPPVMRSRVGRRLPALPAPEPAKGEVETAPWSLRKLLEHLKLNYGNPTVWIHENGYADGPGTRSKAEEEDDDDEDRAEFLQDYMETLYLSIRNGSNARGYFVWSFLDVFEFLFGYRLRFGLCGVDMGDAARTRYMRRSARWYSGFLAGGELRPAARAQKSYVQ